ncbi:MAG TPA: 4'-phosphopantetheinyl transferase superfamily protein, partial [Isosphaeraceae bacterium]|nr:4'-phosphopantetheinyl transferase superfamily protein [Isosphaeraceae bacterium]
PEGDVIFPLRLGTLALYGADPLEGEHVECRITVKELKRSRVLVDAELVGPSGRVWIRITDWEDWRFYWPGRYRDHLRSPNGVLVGTVLELAGASDSQRSGLKAVWLEPPADFGRPVWRDVLEWIDLGPPERAALRAEGGAESRRTQRLWGRVAAKEAVRRLWLDRGEPPVYPADLVIEADERGKPRMRFVAEPQGPALPAISIAHTDGVAVALAALDPEARVGIDVERIEERSVGFEAKAFSASERALLDLLPSPRSAWVARFWCAKEAVAKVTGFGLMGDPANVEIVKAEAHDGSLNVRLGPKLANACPALAGACLKVYSQRRGDYVWAWTIAEGAQP